MTQPVNDDGELEENLAENGSGSWEAEAEAEAGESTGPWDGAPAGIPAPAGHDDAESGRGQSPDTPEEESLEYEMPAARYRLDFPRGGRFRDVAGEIHHHYGEGSPGRRAPGRVGVADLRRATVVHAATPSDGALRDVLLEHKIGFCRGIPGTGRAHSAIAALDILTGYSRTVSKVIVAEAPSGLPDLAGHLTAGCGHLLDASAAPWAASISTAQFSQAREELGGYGFLVILLDADVVHALPGPVVDHVPPDPVKVAVFHLAARLTGDDPPDAETLRRARTRARTVIDEACDADDDTRDWLAGIIGTVAYGPAEAVVFAEAVWDWHRSRPGDASALPRVSWFRGRRRYEQAAALLRRHDDTDPLLRQAYAISAAVLDGLALSEVIDGAGKLAARLAEVEHPGEPGQREIFAQPLVRWLRHTELAASTAGTGDRGGTVVRMPDRELARTVIELAWREYDAARAPVLGWLTELCERHRDHRVRIRAVQALAFIAAHDYPLIKERVLDKWSSRDSRHVEHLAAAWLLEAIVLDKTWAGKVRDLLRLWSRSPDRNKRRVAVRAYGTAIAREAPEDAIAGVRVSAVLPDLGSLPELALCEMYLLGLTREVTAELALWRQGFPAMRDRAGRVLVRISRVRRTAEGESAGHYDLLWLLASAPEEVGASLEQIAGLWHLACTRDSSRSDAWQMLGRWAQSCSGHPGLSGTFARLTDEFEKAAGDGELRGRLGVYRRWWNGYLTEETQK